MGTSFRPALLVVLVVMLFGVVPASAVVTLSGSIPFSTLDNGPLDEDPTLGVFAVSDSLAIEGTVDCTDAPPLPGNANGCPVHLVTGGDLVIEAGGAVVTENQSGPGNGGAITLEAAGDVVLHGPAGSLPGARVSSAKLTSANPGGGQHGGAIDVEAGAVVTLEAGSVVSSAAAAGTAGAVSLVAGGVIRIDGFVGAGPTDLLDADPWVGTVLVPGGAQQAGGAVTVLSASTGGGGIEVGPTAVVVSQGEKGDAGLVLLEACGVEIRGLVASVVRDDGAAAVKVRSGEGAVVDGRDLGLPIDDPGFAGRLGTVRVGGRKSGAPGQRVDLFARGDVQVLGPSPAGPFFAISAVPGTNPHSSGGTVTVLSTEGTLTATGNAFLAGRSVTGDDGGSIDLEAAGDVVLDAAVISAVGNFGSGAAGTGGDVLVQSYQGDLAWTGGVGDVRPVGSGVPAARRGSIALFYCGSIDLNGTAFPAVGAPAAPFPAVVQDCSLPGPTLPPGNVLPVCNQPPVAADDDFTTDEDSPVLGDVLADNGHGPDFDPGGGPLTVTEVNGVAADVGNLVVLPSGALLTLNADGTFTYDPNGQFEELGPGDEATDSFDYTVAEPGGLSDTATVTMTITGVDDAPVAVDDAATVIEDSAANAIDVLANDPDVDGGPKSIQSVTQPAHGAVTITNAGADLAYEPDADYCNDGSPTDDFTYTLDGGSTATVSVTVTCVDDDPVAVDDAATVVEDSGANAIDVLANDTDADGGPKTIESVTQPANGTVAITGGGAGLTYAPDPDYCNAGGPTDDFTYTLNGGSTATVSVTVTCVDDPPVAVADSATVTEDSGVTAIDVLANDTDVDGGPKTIQSVTQPANGTAAITGGGTGVSYAPNANYCNSLPMGVPTDDFTYTLNGGSTATVAVTVTCVNDPPVAADDSFDFVGNTELRVDLAPAATPHALATTGSGFGLLDNDADPVENDPILVAGIVGCADTTAPFDCAIPGAGTVSVESDGSFSFVPEPGDTDASESFQYTLSDGTDTVTATVTLHRFGRVWYVDNATATAGIDGTSVDPFDTLAEAEAASSANDHLFVHFGDGTATGQDAGISLKAGQHLLGEHVGLSLPVSLNGNGAPTVLFAAAPGNRPALGDTVAGGPDGVSAVGVIPAEVAGLALSGDVNALEWTTTPAFPGSGAFEIRDNVVTGAGAIGIDVNLGGSGATQLSFHHNDLTAAGTALQVMETGAGTLTVTAFDDNTVSGATGGSGILMSSVVFDAVPGGGFDTVSGGATVVGAPGDGVGASGVVLTGISGDLLFTDLDVFADGGTGLGVGGTGAVFLAGGTGLRLRVGAGVGTVVAASGPAVDLANLTANLQLATLTSTGSPTTGVSLAGVTDGGGTEAVFSAGSASAITLSGGATGPAFRVDGGNEQVAYAGTVTNNAAAARAVSISGWAGDDPADDLVLSGAIDENGAGILVSGNGGARAITFSGGLDVDTTTGEGFAATSNTNALGLNVTGSANDIDSVSATALRVTSTPIGSSNLSFRHVSSGNDTAAADPANGIVLSGTGSLGGLRISGTGSAGSGGTIQHATSTGISLTDTRSVELASMQLNDFGDFAIRGSSVVGFTMSNSTVSGANGNDAGAFEGSLRFTELTGSASISGSSVSGGLTDNLAIVNTSGTLNRLTLSGVTVGANSTGSGSDGLFVETQGSAVINATVQNSFFTSSRGDLAQFSQGGTGSMDVVIQGTAFSDNHPNIGSGGGGVVVGGTAGSLTFDVHGNAFRDATGTALAITCGNAGQSCVGRVEGNQVGVTGVANSGSTGGSGIAVVSSGGGTLTALVGNNSVRQYNNHGILLQAGQTLGNATSFNVTVTGNTVSEPGTINSNFNGIHLNNGTVPGESFTSCVDIRDNSIAGAGTGAVAPNNADYRLRQRQSTTVRLPGYAGANDNDTAVVAFVSGNQTTVTTGNASNTVGSGGGGFVGGASCALPP